MSDFSFSLHGDGGLVGMRSIFLTNNGAADETRVDKIVFAVF